MVSRCRAVNLSARTFLDYELPAMVARLLGDAGMDLSRLELEITETELMADPARGAKVLERLHAMGIRLTIDDFGTKSKNLIPLILYCIRIGIILKLLINLDVMHYSYYLS